MAVRGWAECYPLRPVTREGLRGEGGVSWARRCSSVGCMYWQRPGVVKKETSELQADSIRFRPWKWQKRAETPRAIARNPVIEPSFCRNLEIHGHACGWRWRKLSVSIVAVHWDTHDLAWGFR